MNIAGENGHHPRQQGGDVHLILVSDAPVLVFRCSVEVFSGVRSRSASSQLRAADQGQARPSTRRFQERQALPVVATSVTDMLPIRPDTDKTALREWCGDVYFAANSHRPKLFRFTSVSPAPSVLQIRWPDRGSSLCGLSYHSGKMAPSRRITASRPLSYPGTSVTSVSS